MIRTPNGAMPEQAVFELFEQVGFKPPPGMSTQDAFNLLLRDLLRQQEAEEQQKTRPGRGRTAVLPSPPTAEAATAVLARHSATVTPMSPCGCEIEGIDIASVEGKLDPEIAGALEVRAPATGSSGGEFATDASLRARRPQVLMAFHGLVLFRRQGHAQNESGVKGRYLSAEQQFTLSECFGAGKLHSTHGVHPESPCRDVFRLSNDPQRGFNSVGTEWHNDGSFCREVGDPTGAIQPAPRCPIGC